MDLTKFLVGGAAARPDSVSGFNPDFTRGLTAMMTAAPPEVQQQLRISSGYRSPEKQAELWAEALKKYGSPDKARKWVAPPGKSKHNAGHAADIQFTNDAAREWAHQNAQKFGLAFPMSHEPWHIELASARGGPAVAFGSNVPAAPGTTQGIASMFAAQPGALPMGAPVDPLAGLFAQQANAAKQEAQDREEAEMTRRRALLSGVGSMFG